MAELLRVTRLQDAAGSQTFTFVLPAATALDSPAEVSSRDFAFAGLRWRLALLKKDKHLSPYLVCPALAHGLRCTLDFSLVLLSRDSFTQNESFGDKHKTFEAPLHTPKVSAFSQQVCFLMAFAAKNN